MMWGDREGEEAASAASRTHLILSEEWLGNETATQCNQGISKVWRPVFSESSQVAYSVSNPWKLLINCERRLGGFSHCRDFNDSFRGQSIFPGERFYVSCLKGAVSCQSEGMSSRRIGDFIFKCEGQWHSWPKSEFSQPWSALLAAQFFAMGGCPVLWRVFSYVPGLCPLEMPVATPWLVI